MTDYKGSWYKGFASTFSQTPSLMLNVMQLKEKKKAQQKIDDAIEGLKFNSITLAGKFDQARADGTITQEEYGDMAAWALPLGDEITGRLDTLTKNYQTLSPKELDNELEDINSFYELSSDLDFQNMEEMKAFGNRLTEPKAKTKWDLIIKSIENRKKPVIPEVFNTPGEVTSKYPEAGYDYTKEGYVPTYQKPTTPELKDIQVKLAEVDKLAFLTEERRNAMKVNILSGSDSATAEKVNAIKAAGGTNADILESLGAGVVGVNPVKETGGRATSLDQLEEYRTKALDADSWKDAEKIINDYTQAGYDTSQLGVTKEAWANSQKEYLNKIKMALDNITNEKGWLQKGTKTSDEVGLDFKGEQKVEDIYKQLYEQYMKYFNMLTEMGLPLLEFPILKPLEEIEKVGFVEGLKTFGGVGRGQYKSIYK